MTNLQNLLFNSSVKKTNKPSTHTRIPDEKLKIFGGNFSIENEEDFYKKLYDFLFIQNKKEYLTEKQKENGTFIIDLDFRYSYDIQTKQHTKNDICNIISLINDKMKKYLNLDNPFRCYVMEKPNVNRLADGTLTKDGIHLLYNIDINDKIKQAIRKDVLQEISSIVNLPLINNWDNVFDERVINRDCNFVIYGCSKPNNEAYEVTDIYEFPENKKVDITYNLEMFKELSVRTPKQIFQLTNEGEQIINFVEKKTNCPISPKSVVETKKTEKYLELLDIIGKGNRQILHPVWFNIGSILKTNGYSKQIFQNFTSQYVPNKQTELNTIWDCIHSQTIYSLYGLQNIAKDVNLGDYNEWFIKNKLYISVKIITQGNNDIANFISKGLKEVLVYSNKQWIMFDNKLGLWRITDAPNCKVCSYIQNLIDNSMETLIYQSNRTEDEEEKKKYASILKVYRDTRISMADSRHNSMILKLLKDYLNDNEFFSRLDINNYIVAFKNGILDLKTKQFREGIFSSDMITQTIPYNYEKALQDDITNLRFELLKICNNNETHLDYYLSALGYAMTGDSMKLQEFYYILGQKASNGKSVIFEALTDIMPCYVKRIESNTFEIKKAQLHKEIATWKGIRIGWVNELSKNKQDAELIKNVADGTGIKYQVMYGICDTMPITFKLFIVSNHSFNMDADKGISRRAKMFQMDSEFIENLECEVL